MSQTSRYREVQIALTQLAWGDAPVTSAYGYTPSRK